MWPACTEAAAGAHALCCACSDLGYNRVRIHGAAALAPALCALTGLTKLLLLRNGISWARLEQLESGRAWPGMDLNNARLLPPLLKSMVARGGDVDLEEAQVRGTPSLITPCCQLFRIVVPCCFFPVPCLWTTRWTSNRAVWGCTWEATQ